MANDKGKKRKRSTETTPKDLTIPVLTRSPPSSECRISRYDLDKIGNNLDIDDVFRDLRLKYVGIDACALLLRMLPRKCIPSNWIVTRILGKGAYGIVIGTRGPMGELGALKITHPRDYSSQNTIQREFKLGEKMHEIGIGVELRHHCSFIRNKKKMNILHMGRIDGTVSSYLQTKKLSASKISILIDHIFFILSKFRESKVTHGDFHLSNIGFIHSTSDNNSKLVAIDFGKTTRKKAVTSYDIIKMLICTQKGYTSYSRSLGNSVTPKTERILENLQTFERLVRIKAQEVYQLEFPNDLDDMLERKDRIEYDNYNYL